MRIPKTEIQWTQYQDSEGRVTHIVTSSESRTFYFMYRVDGNDCTKLGKAKNPIDLEERFLTKKKKGSKKNEKEN